MSLVSFVTPLALAGLGLLAIPIAVHMMRRARSRRLEFPSLEFLRETPSRARRFAAPNRPWLLLLRLLLVSLIVLAFARPVWIGGVQPTTAVIVLVDASASMRRESAAIDSVAAARTVIDGLGPRDRVRIGAFGERITWLGPLSDKAAALRTLSSYEAGYGAARIGPALAEASRELVNIAASRRRIVVVSDFQRSDGPWAAAGIDPSIDLEPVRVGKAYDNTFIASARVSGSGDAARVTVGRVQVGPDGRRAGVEEVPLDASSGTADVRLAQVGGGWTLTASGADEFDADDVRYVVTPPEGRVVVVDARTPYLSVAAQTIFGDAAVTRASALASDELADARLAFVSQTALEAPGAAQTLEEWVRGGGTAVVFAPSPASWPFPTADGDELPTTGIVRSATGADDARLDSALLGAELVGARRIARGTDDRVVAASSSGDPLAVRRTLGRGSVTTVGFEADPDRTPFVRAAEFPAFVEWIGDAAPPSISVGDRLSGLVPGQRVESGSRSLVAGSDGSVIADEPGIYTFDRDGRARSVAVNVPTSESEPAALGDDEIRRELARDASVAAATSAGSLESAEERQSAWRVLLLIAVGLAFVELVAALRRRRDVAPSEEPA